MKEFAFLIHPRDIYDVSRPMPLAKFLPKKLVAKIIKSLPKKLDVYPWVNFDVYGKAKGWIIVVFLTGEQMVTLPRNYVQERILEATLFAQNKLGVSLVGLGAYTAPISDAGRWLVRQKNVKVSITHGDSFSVAVAYEGIQKIASKLGINLKEKEIAVVGAYGLIGKPLSKMLLPLCRSLVLIGRRENKLAGLKDELGSAGAKISANIEDINTADIVVTATSYPGSLIKAEYLKKKAIIYDIAQPINVVPRVCLERPDIIRVDGCYSKIPGIDLKIDMGPPKGTTFSCLAETIMQCLENDHNNHIGEIELEHIQKTMFWQKKYGFEHAELTNFGQPIIFNK